VGTFRVFLIRFATGLVLTAAGITAILAILARVIKSPANLGVRDGKLAPCPNSPNCVSTQSEDPRHQIDPIPYTTSLTETKEALLQVIRSMDRTKIVTEASSYIHAEFRTKGIGYVDDVEFFLDEQTRLIHFRSSARMPYYDWDVNRKRMEAIRAAFEAAEE
jgi:uncharacterized protein (DUF1499 family)